MNRAQPADAPADQQLEDPTPGGAPPTTTKAKTKKQPTLLVRRPDGTASESAPLPAGITLPQRTEVARLALAAAAAARTSPVRLAVGWIDEGTTARVKGTKEIVELFPDGPPFEYYVAPGRRRTVLMCAHCFVLQRMPEHGEENLPIPR